MKRSKILFLIIFFGPTGGIAEVLDEAPGGFTIEHRVTVPVVRMAAWDSFVNGVGSWWHSDHTMSGDAGNLYIDATPLGCFCEKLADNAGLVHLQVTFANPGVMLRLSGGLGPLGLMGVAGNLTVEFEQQADDPGKTVVTMQYAVGGYRAGGLAPLAAPVDSVLGQQIGRFAAYAGNRDPRG